MLTWVLKVHLVWHWHHTVVYTIWSVFFLKKKKKSGGWGRKLYGNSRVSSCFLRIKLAKFCMEMLQFFFALLIFFIFCFKLSLRHCLELNVGRVKFRCSSEVTASAELSATWGSSQQHMDVYVKFWRQYIFFICSMHCEVTSCGTPIVYIGPAPRRSPVLFAYGRVREEQWGLGMQAVQVSTWSWVVRMAPVSWWVLLWGVLRSVQALGSENENCRAPLFNSHSHVSSLLLGLQLPEQVSPKALTTAWPLSPAV